MMSKIDVVITMGGLGSRFKKVGYDVPKYMINANGKTLFELSMLSLEGYRDQVSQYIFVVMKDKKENVSLFIEEECKKLKLTQYHIIVIDYLTDGQATTAMLAEQYWNEEHALLIYNIDTYVESGQMNSAELKGDGFIPCFKANGTHWSFVKTDGFTDRAVEIREKQRISDNCTLGAYYFRSCRLYKSLYEEYYNTDKALVNGEKYVAPLYNFLLEKSGTVYISNVSPEYVHVLGTPEELKAYLNKQEFCGT